MVTDGFGLLGRNPLLNITDSPKTFPASAIHPELNAEEVRSKEIERIARMLCIQIEGSDCCDCEVYMMWGELQRSATGKWMLPPPEARCKLWQLYRHVAISVYEDQQKAKP